MTDQPVQRETKRMKFIGEEPVLFMDVGLLHPGDVVDFPLPVQIGDVDEVTEFSHPLLEETSDELHRTEELAQLASDEAYEQQRLAHRISTGELKVDDGVEPLTPELQALVDRENADRVEQDRTVKEREAAVAQALNEHALGEQPAPADQPESKE